jgi:hypothetical protein
MTTREQAIHWWNGLFEYINPSGINKSALTEKYYGKERRYQSLTGSEVEEIFHKENKTTKNIYLNRLKEQYKNYKTIEVKNYMEYEDIKTLKGFYDSVRLFCLDTQLVSFNDIELMEFEVNQSF